MRLKKLATPVLALTLVLSMSTPALAADKHPFTDVPAWAEAAVTYVYDKGYVDGISATTYNSNGQISVVEFVKVMVQMCTTQEQRTAIMDKAGTTPEQASDWTYQYRTIGKEIGLYAGIEQYESDKGETKCTRAVMAHILVSALKARGEDISTVDANAYIDKFNDATAIKNSPYVNDIGIAISLGLIGGDNNHNFLPDDTMNRASAAQVLLRLDNPNAERSKVLKALDDLEYISSLRYITIDMRDSKTTHRPPMEGDTVIRLDGTSVVLARDPASGVLGAMQNVGPYLQTLCLNGTPLVSGDYTNPTEAGWTDNLAKGCYMNTDLKGWESTWLWTNEWAALKAATAPKVDGTSGQVDSTGLWKYDSDLGGDWIWQGPRC